MPGLLSQGLLSDSGLIFQQTLDRQAIRLRQIGEKDV